MMECAILWYVAVNAAAKGLGESLCLLYILAATVDFRTPRHNSSAHTRVDVAYVCRALFDGSRAYTPLPAGEKENTQR